MNRLRRLINTTRFNLFYILKKFIAIFYHLLTIRYHLTGWFFLFALFYLQVIFHSSDCLTQNSLGLLNLFSNLLIQFGLLCRLLKAFLFFFFLSFLLSLPNIKYSFAKCFDDGIKLRFLCVLQTWHILPSKQILIHLSKFCLNWF